MSVEIKEYTPVLARRFEEEKARIQVLLPKNVTIEHVGSSAVGIGGKNIVDILIGVSDAGEMQAVKDVLVNNGYFEGRDNHADRVFLASSESETGEGDIHIHICPVGTSTYTDFIALRDYLIGSPTKASEYLEKKREFARQAEYDRQKYKALKSAYVSRLLEEAKAEASA